MVRKRAVRKGAQVVELAVLLPFLAFLFVITVDWARVFYYSIAVSNCARNGALYMSQQQSASTTSSPYTDSGYVNLYVSSKTPVTDAALADASDMTPTPTVTSTTGSDIYGKYVEVTVSYPFQTVTSYVLDTFSVPSSTNVTSTIRRYVPPESPNYGEAMRRAPARSAATVVECAVVYPVLFLLVLGMLVGAAGIFRYSQLASLSREAARYACVHGAQYAQEMNVTAPTPADIYNNVVLNMEAGLDPSQLNYSITYTTSNTPFHVTLDTNNNVIPIQNTVTVTLTYQWGPEAFLGGITLSSTSVMPMSY